MAVLHRLSRPLRLPTTPRARGLAAAALAALALSSIAAACRTAPDGASSIRLIDDDGDGRADRLLTLGDGGEVVRVVEAPVPGEEPDRTVVLAIDGIPHELFARLQEEGLFRSFHPASRLVAPFPSLTAVSFTEILGTAPPAAYEDRYFDPVANRIGGGVGERISGDYRERAPFHETFDWEAPRFWGGFVFLVPERVAMAELLRVTEALQGSDDPELVLYLGTTDGLGHEEGWGALETHLRRIDRALTRWLAAGGASRRVVLFSDHGMSRTPTEPIDLEAALERGGFRLEDSVDGPDAVVAPAYGLIGSIQLYTACGREAAVARTLAEAPEVEFAVWQDGERWGAVAGGGPVDLAALPADEYPDLPRRARRGLALTRHPASVIASLAPGAHYGLDLFEPFVSMEGTHGSARRLASTGFLASNVASTPDVLAAAEARPWLGLEGESVESAPAPYRCVAASSRSK